jgi:hypothetical protein
MRLRSAFAYQDAAVGPLSGSRVRPA